MTNKEILQADLLDILFEQRNKAYGAYALRRNYNQRLQSSLFISLCAMLFALLALRGRSGSLEARPEGKIITLQAYADPRPPKQPEQARTRVEPRRAQRQYVAQVEIVHDNVKTNMPDQHELTYAQISDHNSDGVATDDPTSEKTTSTRQGEGRPNDAPSKPEASVSSSEAQYPGGTEAFRKFLMRFLVTPDELQAGEKITVLVRFKVDENGSVSKVEILQSGGTKYDKEVLRVLSKMPQWIPATQNGTKVATWFTQPVTFMGVE